jgi:hypothetical protein
MAAPQNPDLPAAGSVPSPAAALSQPAAPSLAQLQQSLNSLRRLFQISTAALVLFLLALNVFLLNQVRLVRKQGYGLNLQVQEMQRAMNDYRTNGVPWMTRVSTELYRFADTHPDFAATMARYPRPASAPPALAQPPASLAPAPPRAAPPPRKK